MQKQYFEINSIIDINNKICLVLNYFYYTIGSKKENGNFNIIKQYIDSNELENFIKTRIVYFEVLQDDKINSYMFQHHKRFNIKEINYEYNL